MESTRGSLLIRVRDAKDIESWHEFVRLYEPFLLAVARREGLSQEDTHEVCQEVFIKLVQALPTFQYTPSQGHFRGWLKTITRNAVNDLHRYQSRRPTVPLNETACGVSMLGDDNTDWDKAYRQRVLEYALASIKETSESKTWSCFEQHLLAGRPAAKVGTELGLKPNAVYVNASRVLARVRAKCAEYDEDLADA